jgi:sugar phosphate isomerase/epimerase
MFTPGLVTVTFRKLSPAEIIAVARGANLAALEWGGDVHVPPGDLDRARGVRRMTAGAGLRTTCYGSYVRLGEDDPATFQGVIDSARELDAPTIRVWAGRRSPKDADAGYRQQVIDAARRFADLAAAANLLMCYEHHEGTLTETDDSALDVLQKTGDHPAIRTLWQPPHGRTIEQNVASLRALLPWLHHVHVFHWPVRGTRAPLADGADRWNAYLAVLREANKQCPLLLEFVKDDDPAHLDADAATLRGWIASR